MATQYPISNEDPTMVNEDMTLYPNGITIPVTLPSTGNYSVEYLRKEMTAYAMGLLSRVASKTSSSHINWRNIKVSDKVKSMTLGTSSLSNDTRDYKELLAEALDEKYK